MDGKLLLNEDCKMRLYNGGECNDLSEYLEKEVLNHDMKIKITHMGQMVFNEEGLLTKEKVSEDSNLYDFFINGIDMTDVLWSLVNEQITFETSNVRTSDAELTESEEMTDDKTER